MFEVKCHSDKDRIVFDEPVTIRPGDAMQIDWKIDLDTGDVAYTIVRLFHAIAPNYDKSEELYLRLESMSKSLEGSGRLDEHENPDAYATVLDAMNFIRRNCSGQS